MFTLPSQTPDTSATAARPTVFWATDVTLLNVGTVWPDVPYEIISPMCNWPLKSATEPDANELPPLITNSTPSLNTCFLRSKSKSAAKKNSSCQF